MSCARCGHALTPQNQVCPRCGQPAGAPPPDPAPPTPGGYPPPGYPMPGSPPQGAYGPPPGYGPPGYYAPRYPVNVSGSLILVFGILSIVLFFFCPIFGVFGVAAILMGGSAVAAIDRGEADPAQRGSANAGRICGIIGTAFLALSLLVVVIVAANPEVRKSFIDSINQATPNTDPAAPTPPVAPVPPGNSPPPSSAP